MNICGPYAEQNHSSLKASGDRKDRSLEENIRDTIRRTSLIIQKKQQLAYKWRAEAHNELLRILDGKRQDDLKEPRQVLCRVMYKFFEKEYDLRTSYNVEDVIVEGQHGARVRHTSNSNEGYFIPDAGMNGVGEVCPCETEQTYSCGCRHFCAKREHRKEPPFCQPNVNPRHLFDIELRIVERVVKLDEILLQDAESAPAAMAPAIKDAVAPSVKAASGRSDVSHDLVFMSPSKFSTSLQSCTPSAAAAAAAEVFLNKKPCNVGFHNLADAGSKLAKAASTHSNMTQHMVLTVLTDLTYMLDRMDFYSDNYDGTPYDKIAKQLAALSTEENNAIALAPGMPKAKKYDAYGKSTYRKGSDKSTAGRKPGNCGYCQGDRGCHSEHRNMASCGVKKSRGECIKVSAETVHEIGQKLARICDGVEGFGDVSYHAAFNQHLYIDCLPSGTKRFQIKAYCTTERGKYLLCALLNNRGWPLQVSHGHNTVNYENVFLSEMGAVQGVGKCDFIFFNKIKVPLEECHRIRWDNDD
jgi:hypothetical protein